MKKLNKKGFTLVEMLVVIAIIAILVAVIVPTVSSSTNKAKAATDAANLRSAEATLTIGALSDKYKSGDAPSADDAGVPATSKYDSTATFSASVGEGGKVTVKYGSYGIDYYAYIAQNGNANGYKAPGSSTSKN